MYRMEIFGQRPDGLVVATYFNCPAEVVCNDLRSWGNREDRIDVVAIRDWHDAFPDFEAYASCQIVSQVNGSWSVHCENGHGLTTGLPRTMAARLKTRVIRITTTWSPDAMYPSCFMEYHEGGPRGETRDRIVGVSWDPKPIFLSEGNALDFEDVSAYSQRRILDRMTLNRLELYGRTLGFELMMTSTAGPSFLMLDKLVRKGVSKVADRLRHAQQIARTLSSHDVGILFAAEGKVNGDPPVE